MRQEGKQGALRAAVLGKLARDRLTKDVLIQLKKVRELAMDAHGGKQSGGGNSEYNSAKAVVL